LAVFDLGSIDPPPVGLPFSGCLSAVVFHLSRPAEGTPFRPNFFFRTKTFCGFFFSHPIFEPWFPLKVNECFYLSHPSRLLPWALPHVVSPYRFFPPFLQGHPTPTFLQPMRPCHAVLFPTLPPFLSKKQAFDLKNFSTPFNGFFIDRFCRPVSPPPPFPLVRYWFIPFPPLKNPPLHL